MPTHKKAVKKLCKLLERGQADDFPIPAPTVLSIKFYLRNHRRTSHISVECDPIPEEFSEAAPPECSSKFIMSQLEAQKIANMSRSSSQVRAVLAITSRFLDKHPLERPSYPTLFTWHSQSNHRTYCLFAYLTHSMETRVYTASELLKLRSSHSSDSVLDSVKSNSDLGKNLF